MANQQVVLVVDDEPAIRIFVCNLLSENEFAPLAASSADEALGILQNRHEIACVLTDVVMPGILNGLGLISEIRRRWPRIPVVMASDRMPSAAAENAPDTVFLAKPFGEFELLVALGRARLSNAE